MSERQNKFEPSPPSAPRFRSGRLPLMAAGAVLLLTLGASKASADYIFDLNLGNSAISGYLGPYANVDIGLIDSTHAIVTFTSYTNNGNIYLMGDGGTVGVNVNAASWNLSNITGSNAGTGFAQGGPYSNGGSGNEDGWGSFNQTINTFDGFTHSSDTVRFELTNLLGNWGDASDVLTANASGYLAAAHIFVTGDPANAANGALTTGYATGNGGSSSVPEPNSGAILGTLWAGAWVLSRRRRQSQE
ncbi:MAG TPA: PEP-CTERM sorting domain-containing protein [Bryobacteraceae bacterium]|nr:PEP-CTERM sorting domain-containing protein [Bryobacteraceae bacterium]